MLPLQLAGEILNQVIHTKFLGVWIDENLLRKWYIDDVCFKFAKIICGLFRKYDTT